MNPMLFLNMAFQYAALNNFAKMLDEKYGDQGGCFCRLPDEAAAAFKGAQEEGEEPKYICSEEWGHFVTHTFKGDEDEDDPGMRMVCWAEMGPEAFNKTACEWWKAQGANPDKIAPGVTTLHQEPESEPEPEPSRGVLSRDTIVLFIRDLGTMNPEGDPHGMIDPQFTKACRDYDPDRETETPLTLEEWKSLRESGDYNTAFSRDILDATDPLVFLAVLRDRMVFASGCSDMVITLISSLLDPLIEAHSMTWRT